VTGLGNAAYTGSNDPAESTVYGTENYKAIFLIAASDVTLDGLTITVKPTKTVEYAIGIFADTGDTFARVKVTNCVIRHLLSTVKALSGCLISASGS